ncbi:murein DD-endopeptidase MepM/ murein hydrolase activator NlpD [Prauserella sediminis]|uniref:Murein DD-endopeptidase MepM/ murein hydrolase activator NlpD n=1 Tax=Prauserella sediminis TaxID=577680 RepID=A0A839XF58_9PSEU|nr:M23 family metallopeptidase [Prauserella sediminis]MBB3661391.1 murein DD-endopeptidase MepM/ murein hydrolase activator NlpD [Prauserella sediminis]
MAVAVVTAVVTVVTAVTALVPPDITAAPGPRSGAGGTAGTEIAGAEVAGAETAAVRSLRATGEPHAEVTFTWPLTPQPEVVRPFDPPDSEYGPGHRGVDLAAEPGKPVSAAAAGRIVHAGDLAGRGVVSIEHPGGLRTTYEPLSVQVAEGERVEAGRRIGTVTRGHDGCDRAACLHWGLRRGERYLDPLTVVPAAGPLRLKPWPG